MAFIELTQGKRAEVDDADLPLLRDRKWCYILGAAGNEYAISNYPNRLLMHRAILSAPKGMDVDHADGNGLNNKRSNLRLCTQIQNCFNRRVQKNKRLSRFKGVSPSPGGKWRARIMAYGKWFTCNSHQTEESAARAYDALARQHHGPFARLNFPD